MKASTIQWHLARDNQSKLARFCEQNKTNSVTELLDDKYFLLTSFFDNDGYITAELRRGDAKGYTVADHYQVTDYSFGVR